MQGDDKHPIIHLMTNPGLKLLQAGKGETVNPLDISNKVSGCKAI
jgi:hypothetical protein